MQGLSKNENLSTQRPWDKAPRCLEELKGGQCISRGKGWEREGWAKFVQLGAPENDGDQVGLAVYKNYFWAAVAWLKPRLPVDPPPAWEEQGNLHTSYQTSPLATRLTQPSPFRVKLLQSVLIYRKENDHKYKHDANINSIIANNY